MHCPALDSCVLVCARLLYMYVSTTLVYVCVCATLVYVCVRDSHVCLCATPSYSSKPPRNSTVRWVQCACCVGAEAGLPGAKLIDWS